MSRIGRTITLSTLALVVVALTGCASGDGVDAADNDPVATSAAVSDSESQGEATPSATPTPAAPTVPLSPEECAAALTAWMPSSDYFATTVDEFTGTVARVAEATATPLLDALADEDYCVSKRFSLDSYLVMIPSGMDVADARAIADEIGMRVKNDDSAAFIQYGGILDLAGIGIYSGPMTAPSGIPDAIGLQVGLWID